MPKFTLDILLQNLTVSSTHDKILNLQAKIFNLKRQLYSDNENIVLEQEIKDNEEQLKKLQKQESEEQAALQRKRQADQATKDILHARYMEAKEKLLKLNELAYKLNKEKHAASSELAMDTQSQNERLRKLSLMAESEKEIHSLSTKLQNTMDMRPLLSPVPTEVHDCLMELSQALMDYFDDPVSFDEGSGDCQYALQLADLCNTVHDVLGNWGEENGQKDRSETCKLLQTLKQHAVQVSQLEIRQPLHHTMQSNISRWTQIIENRINEDSSKPVVLFTTIAPISVPPDLPDMSRLSLDIIEDTDAVYKDILYWVFDEPVIATNAALPWHGIAVNKMKKFVEDRKNMLHRLILCKFDTLHQKYRHYLPTETIEPITPEELQHFDYSVVNKFDVFECLKEIILDFWTSAPQIHGISAVLQTKINTYFQSIFDALTFWHKRLHNSMTFFEKKAFLKLDFTSDDVKIELLQGLPTISIKEASTARVDEGQQKGNVSRQGHAARRYRRPFPHTSSESSAQSETGKRKIYSSDDDNRPSRRAGPDTHHSESAKQRQPKNNQWDTESDSDAPPADLQLTSFLQNSKCPYAWKFVSYLLHKIPDDVSG
jgi:hypothetical protein